MAPAAPSALSATATTRFLDATCGLSVVVSLLVTATESARDGSGEAATPLAMRAFSLTGVVPLAAFLVVHLGVCGALLFGERAFVRAASLLAHTPVLVAAEAVLVWLPLAVHSVLGVYVLASRKPLAPARPYSPLASRIVRGTAIIAFAFLAGHVWELRVAARGVSPEAFTTILEARLSSTVSGIPFLALAYLVGVSATVVHVAMGLWGFFATTTRGSSESARARAKWVLGALGSLFLLVGALIVVALATGTRFFAPEVEPPDVQPSDVPCPRAS
jgi:succinate dehydrogenase / fumarate reductase cytochrome b subunit